MNRFGVHFGRYDCFDDQAHKLTDLKRFNIVIGKNNCGKSKLLDVYQFAITSLQQNLFTPFLKKQDSSSKAPVLRYWVAFSKDDAQELIARSGQASNSESKRLLRSLVGKAVPFDFMESDLRIRPGTQDSNDAEGLRHLDRLQTFFAKRLKEIPEISAFAFLDTVRINADRDVRPESEKSDAILRSNGENATAVIFNYQHSDGADYQLIERDVLDGLNEIFDPDFHFEDIRTRFIGNGRWEVNLVDKKGNIVPLSRSGSGLKTVLLILLATKVNVFDVSMRAKPILFMFEEVENNLHPATIRRLLRYLENAVQEGQKLLLTTHSPIIVNHFAGRHDSTITYVERVEDRSTIRSVDNDFANKQVLDDLQFRASDLLQANAVIWVEGPSDRIYLRKWIDLWSGGRLIESMHYQFAFYGGSILRHFSGSYVGPSDNQSIDDTIKLMKFCRNTILICDKDDDDGGAKSTTKRRVCDEVRSTGGVAWITEGREMENYIPREIWEELGVKEIEEMMKPVSDFAEYLPNGSKSLGGNKVKLAEQVIASGSSTFEIWKEQRDLDRRMQEICSKLFAWNGLPSS